MAEHSIGVRRLKAHYYCHSLFLLGIGHKVYFMISGGEHIFNSWREYMAGLFRLVIFLFKSSDMKIRFFGSAGMFLIGSGSYFDA